MDLRLFHISDDPTIKTFIPRPAAVAPDRGPIVWAIAASHLPNYLLPRVWPLHEAVAKSTLEFSMIRIRNALNQTTTD